MEKKSRNPSKLKPKFVPNTKVAQTSRQFLEDIFLRNGYVKIRNPQKWEQRRSNGYRKGFEIRFVSNDKEELHKIQDAISALGFKVCKPYNKARHMIQPLYGKDITLQFQDLKKQTLSRLIPITSEKNSMLITRTV